MVEWFYLTGIVAIAAITALISLGFIAILILAKYANLMPGWL